MEQCQNFTVVANYGYFANVPAVSQRIHSMLTLKEREIFVVFSLCGIVIVKFRSVRHYCNIVQLILINLQHYDLLIRWRTGRSHSLAK